MEIPRFEVNAFEPRIAGAEPGAAFQVFAAEVLRERYPQLHAYRAGGRDGCIDLDTPSQVVIECKYCGGRDVESAWKDVAAKLDKHLADASAPGQSQYAPWYVQGEGAITKFVLATNEDLPNKSHKDPLLADMRAFFAKLAGRAHLAHLRALEVEIVDWSDLETELKTHPALVFRWFPLTRPKGLAPLDAVQDGRLFRSFLNESTLPYYSRSAHLAITGAGASPAASEDALLDRLNDVTGLIITGKGGVGKTRLTLELGRRAKDRGWLVLRAASSFTDEALDELLVRLVEPADVLVLVDYVETIATFADRIEHIEMLNATVRHRIRYIANCRTSYYRNLQSIAGHERIDVTPSATSPASWLDSYRRAVVEKILGDAGIETTPMHLQVCRDIPVFAVFMAYLRRRNRADDLRELVRDGEFGTWIARRVQQSFGRPIARDLTMLLAAFPMDDAHRASLPALSAEVFERLATDGWIEQLTDGPEAGQWVTAHDALVDRVIVNYIESLSADATRAFVCDLLDFAEAHDHAASVLIALQRLSDVPAIQSLDWVTLLAERVNRATRPWMAARRLILQNNLLTAAARIALLAATADRWEDLTGDVTFQNVLGWLCKQYSDSDAADEPPEHFRQWVVRCAAQLNASNYLLTRGLMLFPELRDLAARWLAGHPVEFQTHYLLVAWLRCGFDADEVQSVVEQWLKKHPATMNASFVLKSWLNAGGAPQVVERSVQGWLLRYREQHDAQFILHAWLIAGGDRALIEESMDVWLEKHAESETARFVFEGWLDSEGDREHIRGPVRKWLAIHGDALMAGSLCGAWLRHGGELSFAAKAIHSWLRLHGSTAQAGFVYEKYLHAGGDLARVGAQVVSWLHRYGEADGADYVVVAYLKHGGALRNVRRAAVAAMRRLRESVNGAFISKVLARQRWLPDEVVLDVLIWCKVFHAETDAVWRLSQLTIKMARPDVAPLACEVVELVLQRWLDPAIDSHSEEVATNVTHVVVAATAFRDPVLRDRAYALLAAWIRHPSGLDRANLWRGGIARRLIAHAGVLLERRLLDIGADAAALARVARWAQRVDPGEIGAFGDLPQWFRRRAEDRAGGPAMLPALLPG